MTDYVLENFKPQKKQVLLIKHKQPETNKHGLVLVSAGDDHPNFGDVVAVGDEVEIVKAGNVVIFNHYAGNRVTYKDEELFFMSEDDILALVEDGDATL
jgi:chaperonin GroES